MTTTTALPLNVQARAMLKEFHRQTGVVSPSVETAVAQHVEQAAQAAGGTVTALDCDTLEKILVQAMPDKKQVIENAKGCGNRYHGDKHNGRFLTQILSMRIEKETHNVYSPPAPTTPRVVDPLYASFTMAPDADVMLLFNARDVDSKGQPVLMKVVARERFDMTGFDFSKYRLNPNGTQPDVVRIKDTESYVETKDVDEAEFSFGDPLKQVSLNNKSEEISTSVWVRPENIDKQRFFASTRDTNNRVVPNLAVPYRQFDRDTTGDNLDRTPVKSFSEKVRLTLTTDKLPAGAWLDAGVPGANVSAKLSVDRGFIFEPGSRGVVALEGAVTASVNVEVDAADAHLLGNNGKNSVVSMPGTVTLRQLLSSNLVETTNAQANNTDRAQTRRPISAVVFGDAAARQIAGRPMSVLGDVTLTAGELAAAKLSATAKPLPRDPEEDGVTVSLTLHDAFLAATDAKVPTSFKGYTVVAGFTDVDGSWKEQVRSVKSEASCKEAFAFECNDFDGLQKANKNLEIRLFNADGVPAQRVLVPFRQVQWA